MSRVLGLLILLLLLAVGGAYALSPIYAMHQLQEAARSGDRDRLEALVDFPAVREDLRAQTETKASRLAREAGGIGHPLAQLFGRAAAAVSDRAIDRLVTPDAISELVRDAPLTPAGKAGPGKGGKAKSGKAVRYGYLTPDRFRITISPSKSSAAAVALIMDRRGLFSWRVEKIQLRALADEDMVKDLY